MSAQYEGLRNAIVLQDLKQSALYFDRILPVCFRQIRGGHGLALVDIPEEIPSKPFVEIVYGPGASKQANYATLFFDFFDRWQAFARAVSPLRKPSSSADDTYEDLSRLYMQNPTIVGDLTVRDAFREFSRSLGADFSTVVLFEASDTNHPDADLNNYALSLSNLQLVDAGKAEWEQITEFRQDAESAKMLRRLRLFFFEKYLGKELPFIKDDIFKRLEDYENVRKKFGFEALTGSLSSLFSATNLTSAVGTGVAASLFGGPLLGLGVAAVVELGSFCLEFSKKKFAIEDFEKGHDFAYLVELRKQGRGRQTLELPHS